MTLAAIGFAFLAFAGTLQFVTTAGAALRLLPRGRRPEPLELPPVTLIRPVCGLENFIEECVETSFRLTYQNLELIFCVDEESDPIVPVVRRLVANYPGVDARLLVGRDSVGSNPKLNNVVKGWHAARSDLVIMSDSNALLPPDYVERLLERWNDKVGVVSTATVVTRPEGFPSELEGAFMNGFQARWVLAADMVGYGFALGKTLMWRKSALDRLGGLSVLAEEAAEDIASTKVLRGTPLRPRLAIRPIEQPVGRRSFATMWGRQLRWARLRRAGLAATYLPEIVSGGLFPILTAIALAVVGLFSWPAVAAYALGWYALEALLCAIGRWPLRPMSVLSWLVRDALIPVLWVGGWIGNSFEWRGNVMTVKRGRSPAEPTEA